MNDIEPILETLLHEGYMLYPYRPSAIKNRFRWVFGGCYPPAWSNEHPDDPSQLGAAVLLEAEADAVVEVEVELWFMQPGDGPDGTRRRVRIGAGAPGPMQAAFEFGPLQGTAVVRARTLDARRWRLELCVTNTSAHGSPSDRDRTVHATLSAVHFVARSDRGRFISIREPPRGLEADVAECLGPPLWPFLLDADGHTIVCSPIILDDAPRIAPESAGDMFDATEIDEMLTLRVLTMTDDETREAAASSARVRALLERSRSLEPEQRARLLGAIDAGGRRPLVGRAPLRAGDRVRLAPRRRADALDVVLRGRTATVTGTEVDFEGQRYVTVVIDGDPGADLGRDGQPGHRFFFAENEVERL